MNLRYIVGRKLNRLVHWVLSRSWFPLTRYMPRGMYWLYDIQRFAGTKNIPVIFDVGANVGQTLNGVLKYFPKSKVYCFEPISSSFNVLNERYGRIENVSLNKIALGSTVSTALVELHQNAELNTLVSNQPRQDDFLGESEKVSIDRLDSFCKVAGVERIDVLKMDVQGWEMEVLVGAMSFIESNRIGFIYAEVGFRKDDSDMQYFSDINAFLEKNGFWLCGFYESFRWGDKKQYVGFANALYLNQDFVGHY